MPSLSQEKKTCCLFAFGRTDYKKYISLKRQNLLSIKYHNYKKKIAGYNCIVIPKNSHRMNLSSSIYPKATTIPYFLMSNVFDAS